LDLVRSRAKFRTEELYVTADQSNAEEGRKNRKVLIASGLITAVGGIVVAAIALVPNYVKPEPKPSPSRSTTPCEKFALTKPDPGQDIDGRKGVTVKGTSCNLDGKAFGWVFDYDPEVETYFSVSERPIDRTTWSASDRPVGDEGDDHKDYTIVVILADEKCNAVLKKRIADGGGETKFKEIPKGCSRGPTRDIVVTYPEE
jgi:hypothetical protein